MARGRFVSKSISVSEQMDELIDAEGFEAALIITWLITHLDAEGRFRGGPRAIKGAVCPLRNDIDADKVAAVVVAADDAGLLHWYECDGDSCIWFPRFDEHQQGLRKDREASSTTPEWLPEYSRPAPGVRRGKGREVKSRKGSKGKGRQKAGGLPEVPAEKLVLTMPTVGGEYPISSDNLPGWEKAYPAVDIRQELHAMREWCLSYPKKQKTAGGVRGFITHWLKKEQNQGGNSGRRNSKPSHPLDNVKPPYHMTREEQDAAAEQGKRDRAEKVARDANNAR